MRGFIETMLLAVLALFLSQVPLQNAQADGGKIRHEPVWKIFEPGTEQFVTWRKHRPNKRFRIYDAETRWDESDDLVLDTETGLVWERAPRSEPTPPDTDWRSANARCLNLTLGGRSGWRLPAIEELQSLVDPLAAIPPTLPQGHPFIGIQFPGPDQQRHYWSASTRTVMTSSDAIVWVWTTNFATGRATTDRNIGLNYYWCVRGGVVQTSGS